MESTKLATTTEPAKINWKESLINLLQQSGYEHLCDYESHITLDRRTSNYLEKITISDGFTTYWAKDIFNSNESVVLPFYPNKNHAAAVDAMRNFGVFNATEQSIRRLIGKVLFDDETFTTLGNALNPAL